MKYYGLFVITEGREPLLVYKDRKREDKFWLGGSGSLIEPALYPSKAAAKRDLPRVERDFADSSCRGDKIEIRQIKFLALPTN